MKTRSLHPWTLTPQEAVALQRELVRRVVTENCLGQVRYVAGADVAISQNPPLAYAGVLILSYPDLRIVEKRGVVQALTFPYIPGLLAFREAPALLKAFEQLDHEPDLVMIDGQGLAHPRGFGIACHIGLWLNKPTIGCAKSRLFGEHPPPPVERGSWTSLSGHRNQVIGAALRTKDNTHPIYVSVGHKVDLPTAIRYTLACARDYRIPEPTRQADMYVGRLKQSDGVSTTID